MAKKNIQIFPFKGEKEKWRMWSVKFMARAVLNGYRIILTDDKKIPADDAD